MDIVAHMEDYAESVKRALDAVDRQALAAIVDVLAGAHREGRRVYLCGNGGSAATASHFANDLAKGAAPPGGRGLRAMALTDGVPILTAWANDESYADAFAQQLETLMEAGDILIAISGSGNSENVVRAVETCRRLGGKSISFAGRDGGRLAQAADMGVVVGIPSMEQIEDLHLVLEHMIVSTLRRVLQA